MLESCTHLLKNGSSLLDTSSSSVEEQQLIRWIAAAHLLKTADHLLDSSSSTVEDQQLICWILAAHLLKNNSS
jgi:hypothetical protein